MDYYTKEQFIAAVTPEDTVVGTVEKWKAHTEGILHRAFTLSIVYNNRILLQHRKHPAFDGYFDLALSSHQLYIDGQLQNDEEAIYQSLLREWNITSKEIIKQPVFKGKVTYKAKDGKFTEHEVDYVYEVTVSTLPSPNFEYAYGYSLVPKEVLYDKSHPLQHLLAPWVKKILNMSLL